MEGITETNTILIQKKNIVFILKMLVMYSAIIKFVYAPIKGSRV